MPPPGSPFVLPSVRPVAPRSGPSVGRRRRKLTKVMLVIIVVAFAAKIANYAFPEAIRFANVGHWISSQAQAVETWIADQPLFHSCPRATRMLDVSGGYLCVDRSGENALTDIFDSEPLNGGAREEMYTAIASGSRATANALMHGVVDVPRYRPVQIAAEQ